MTYVAEALSDAKKAFSSGIFNKAEMLCQQALICNESEAEALHLLGLLNYQKGDNDNAESCIRKALQFEPYRAIYYNSLGIVLAASGRTAEAIENYQQAIKIKPAFAHAHNNLGLVFQENRMLDEAVESYHKALAVKADFATVYNNLGNAFRDAGRLDEAIQSYRQALDLKPDFSIPFSNYLYTLNFYPDCSPDLIFLEHKRWAASQKMSACKCSGSRVPYTNNRSHDRCLKVGYVSPDFRAHPVANFIEPVLANHDPEKVEIFCYSNLASVVESNDLVTERIKSMVGNWVNIHGRSDADVFKLITDDKIDILVDLSGHSENNRLSLFLKKPAPIQVTYLGYPNTTGLEEMDYLLTDEIIDPPGRSNRYTEKILYLQNGFACYFHNRDSPDVAPPPALSRGYVTFASFNDLSKLNDNVISLWSRLLEAVPGSRLVIYRDTLKGSIKDYFYRRFIDCGINEKSLELRCSPLNGKDYLSDYQDIDIALDTFPWNGHATTCETLWMGVPVITLSGKTHASRMTSSVLSVIGLSHLIAGDEDEYIRIAEKMAGNISQLEELRMSLRNIMLSSPLCDGKSFTKNLEDTYRSIWVKWCSNKQDI